MTDDLRTRAKDWIVAYAICDRFDNDWTAADSLLVALGIEADAELGRNVRKIAARDFEWDSGHGDLMPCVSVRAPENHRLMLAYEGDTFDAAVSSAAKALGEKEKTK